MKMLRVAPWVFLLATSCTPSPDFSAFDRLVADHQYESAWVALDKVEPQDDRVLDRRIHLCLDGFVQSVNHIAFGLKDLAPGETLDAVRQEAGTYPLHPFDVPAQVAAWQANHPRSALLDRALGDFYEQVSRLFESYATMNQAQIIDAALRAYGDAWKAAPFAGPSGEAYSILLLRTGQWDRAVVVLDTLLGAGAETHRDAHYNKAFALWQTKNYDQAIREAELAYTGYQAFPELQVDATLMLFDIRLAQGDFPAAAQVLERAASAPADGRLAKRRMQLGLARKDSVEAASGAHEYLVLAPGNPQVVQEILDAYLASAPAELDLLMPEQIGYWDQQGEHGVEGLLEGMWAGVLLDEGRPKEAARLIDRSEAVFRQTGPLGPEVREYLAQLRSRL